MIDSIKSKLLANPIHIVNILEYYEFSNIVLKTNCITCGLQEGYSSRTINIKLENNEKLIVKDFARGVMKDIINFIMISKEKEFKEVINKLKQEVGIDGFYESQPRLSVFGGFYNKIKKYKKDDYEQTIYEENILNKYLKIYSYEFIKENISIESQNYFHIMFDAESQRTIFPIYDWCGNIIGIKGRANWDISDIDPKYLYILPCSIRNTLYGYSHNYTYMQNDIVIICESEKAVQQAYSYGFRNIVSLSCSTITPQQCRLIMQLNPTRVIFANDEGLGIDIIEENIRMLSLYNKFKEVDISFWDYRKSKYIKEGSKDCITDMGKDIFYQIIESEFTNGGVIS